MVKKATLNALYIYLTNHICIFKIYGDMIGISKRDAEVEQQHEADEDEGDADKEERDDAEHLAVGHHIRILLLGGLHPHRWTTTGTEGQEEGRLGYDRAYNHCIIVHIYYCTSILNILF